jgi:hypothetical protein
MARWNIVIAKARTYQQTITINGVADIATATRWVLECAFPNETPFLVAATDNGLMLAGAAANQKILVVPAASTELFKTGNGRFDFYIEWAGGVKRPYYIGGSLSVIPFSGEVLP